MRFRSLIKPHMGNLKRVISSHSSKHPRRLKMTTAERSTSTRSAKSRFSPPSNNRWYLLGRRSISETTSIALLCTDTTSSSIINWNLGWSKSTQIPIWRSQVHCYRNCCLEWSTTPLNWHWTSYSILRKTDSSKMTIPTTRNFQSKAGQTSKTYGAPSHSSSTLNAHDY